MLTFLLGLWIGVTVGVLVAGFCLGKAPRRPSASGLDAPAGTRRGSRTLGL